MPTQSLFATRLYRAELSDERGFEPLLEDLADACANPPEVPDGYSPNKVPLIAAVKSMVDRVARGLPPPGT